MQSPEVRIPRQREPERPSVSTSQFALATLAKLYGERRGAAPVAVEVAFAAIGFRWPFTKADIYHTLNTQYSEPKSAAGRGPRDAISYYQENGFVRPVEVKNAHKGKKFMTIGAPLVAFARGYNAWHIDLIRWCQGDRQLVKEEILERARKVYAIACGLDTKIMTYSNLAQKTNKHPETVVHLALNGWSATQQGLTASVRTLRDQLIIAAASENERKNELVQTDGSLQAVAPGNLVSASASSRVTRNV